ncbi:MAG: phosphate signaling complex PhoU family protein [Acidimicrobiales bacterium]
MTTSPTPEVNEGHDHIEAEVSRLFALVSEGLAGATDALLSGDRAQAQALVAGDEVVDRISGEVEDLVRRRLVDAGLVRAELPYLVAVLQILPELERSADLAEHIAQRAGHGLGEEMSPRSRGIVQRMAEVGLEMWRTVADAYADRAPEAASELDEADEELDALHTSLTAEVARGGMPIAVATEVTLLARFYERLGDHAVNLGRRIARMAAGQL